MDRRTSSFIGDFIVNNIKTILTCLIFFCGLYIQHEANMMKIEQMERELTAVQSQLDVQYAKLDNIKLDKAVFEATMKQFSDMQTDIREIRVRLEESLGNHKPPTTK